MPAAASCLRCSPPAICVPVPPPEASPGAPAPFAAAPLAWARRWVFTNSRPLRRRSSLPACTPLPSPRTRAFHHPCVAACALHLGVAVTAEAACLWLPRGLGQQVRPGGGGGRGASHPAYEGAARPGRRCTWRNGARGARPRQHARLRSPVPLCWKNEGFHWAFYGLHGPSRATASRQARSPCVIVVYWGCSLGQGPAAVVGSRLRERGRGEGALPTPLVPGGARPITSGLLVTAAVGARAFGRRHGRQACHAAALGAALQQSVIATGLRAKAEKGGHSVLSGGTRD
jgi:hypothetical protein